MKLGKASDTKISSQVTMMTKTKIVAQQEHSVTAEEVERVLAVGELLLAVLTPEELETFRLFLNNQQLSQECRTKIGNASGS